MRRIILNDLTVENEVEDVVNRNSLRGHFLLRVNRNAKILGLRQLAEVGKNGFSVQWINIAHL